MKRFFLYSIVAILALGILPGCALATTAESPIILGDYGDESCYATLQLPNGNIILSLTSTGGRNGAPLYGGSIRKVWLLCLAPDGSTVWETELGEDIKGGYTTMISLTLNDNDTFTGRIRYTISQHPQYWQEMTFSCNDGTLISEGEKIPDAMETQKTSREYFTVGNQTILREVHNCESTCDPCTLHMIGPDGNEQWCLDTDAIGLEYMVRWVPAPGGAILYGMNRTKSSPNRQAVALLVDPDGNIVWYRAAAVFEYASLSDAIVDSNGRFVGLGFARNNAYCENNGYNLGFDSFNQLLVCWDAATGEEVWQKTTELTDRQLPSSYLAETDGQYILTDSGSKYKCCVFETVDTNGNELQYWTTSFPGCTHFTPRFFTWNGELWTRTSIEDSDDDIVLERVQIPDNR